MRDIRKVDILKIYEVLARGAINRIDLLNVLTNSVAGSGGRFDGLIEYLQHVEFIELSRGRIKLKISISNYASVEEAIIGLTLNSKWYRSQFASNCKSVVIQKGTNISILINISQTSFRFLWFLSLLDQFGVLVRRNAIFFEVLAKWHNEFVGFVSCVNKESLNLRNRISPREYEEKLQERLRLGLVAEEFVFEFEKRRLSGHPLIQDISHVAKEDVSAGFDILSFNKKSDLTLGRYIEVKSWEFEKKFYLTRNEYNQARKMLDRYFIYLVDRKEIDNTTYTPVIISNPYKRIFEDGVDWKIENDGWVVIGSDVANVSGSHE